MENNQQFGSEWFYDNIDNIYDFLKEMDFIYEEWDKFGYSKELQVKFGIVHLQSLCFKECGLLITKEHTDILKELFKKEGLPPWID